MAENGNANDPIMPGEANIFAVSPEGFKVHFKLVSESHLRLPKELAKLAAHLIEKDFRPEHEPPAHGNTRTDQGQRHDDAPRDDYRPRQNQRTEMFNTRCDDCGNNTKVPFQPKGDRPVYCRDCYSRNRQPARRY